MRKASPLKRRATTAASRHGPEIECGDFVSAKIEVEKAGDLEFRVRITEGGSQTTHGVTLDPKDHSRLAGATAEPEELIRKSFEFLLEREPKESILKRFDLSVISRYFPEYEREIKKRLL
jgi:hypothetical protein